MGHIKEEGMIFFGILSPVPWQLTKTSIHQLLVRPRHIQCHGYACFEKLQTKPRLPVSIRGFSLAVFGQWHLPKCEEGQVDGRCAEPEWLCSCRAWSWCRMSVRAVSISLLFKKEHTSRMGVSLHDFEEQVFLAHDGTCEHCPPDKLWIFEHSCGEVWLITK